MTVTMKCRRVNSITNPPWMTRNKKSNKLEKNKLHSRRETATLENRKRYQHSLRAFRNLIRQSKQDYEKRIAHDAKTNLKKFFSSIRSKKKVKNNIGPLADESGKLTQDSRHMARILNKNFSSVFTIENMESVPVAHASPSGITPL